MTGYALGDAVRFTHRLERRARPNPNRGRRQPDEFKVWEAQYAPHGRHGGIIVGRRTLSDGENERGWYDQPTIYTPTRHFTAYLVAWHLDKRPVLVLPEHLEPREILELAPPPATEADTPLDGLNP